MFMEFAVHRLSGIALDESGDPSRLITNIVGSMRLESGRDIGRIRAKRVMLSQAYNEKLPWADVCDDSQELAGAYEGLCEDDWTYKDFIQSQAHDLLFIDGVEVAKEFRGHSLGKAMALELIEIFQSGCAVIALEAHPLRHTRPSEDKSWDTAMRWDSLARTEAQYAAGAKKLRRHWRSLGFKPVPQDKHLMYRDCGAQHPVKQAPIRASLELLGKRFGG